jgi:hypothetical protein
MTGFFLLWVPGSYKQQSYNLKIFIFLVERCTSHCLKSFIGLNHSYYSHTLDLIFTLRPFISPFCFEEMEEEREFIFPTHFNSSSFSFCTLLYCAYSNSLVISYSWKSTRSTITLYLFSVF